MSRLLEDLQPGTAVRAANGEQLGEVCAVYALGETLAASYLLIYWTQRDEQTLLNADEVSNITDSGVVLRSNPSNYAELPAFDPSANPMLHRL